MSKQYINIKIFYRTENSSEGTILEGNLEYLTFVDRMRYRTERVGENSRRASQDAISERSRDNLNRRFSQELINQRNDPEYSHKEDNQYYTIACKRDNRYNYTVIKFVSI